MKLITKFIQSFKSLANTSIIFDQKPDKSLHLYINYQGLNNPTIKNWYSLPLIEKILNKLGWAKHFTLLNLTNAYHKMRIQEGEK